MSESRANKSKKKSVTKEVESKEEKLSNEEVPVYLFTVPLTPLKRAKKKSEGAEEKSINLLAEEAPKDAKKVDVSNYCYQSACLAVEAWLIRHYETENFEDLWGDKNTSGVRSARECKAEAICNMGLRIGKTLKNAHGVDLCEYRADYDPLKGMHFNINLFEADGSRKKLYFAFGIPTDDSVYEERYYPVDNSGNTRRVNKRLGDWACLAYLSKETASSLETMPQPLIETLHKNGAIVAGVSPKKLTSADLQLCNLYDHFLILKNFQVLKVIFAHVTSKMASFDEEKKAVKEERKEERKEAVNEEKKVNNATGAASTVGKFKASKTGATTAAVATAAPAVAPTTPPSSTPITRASRTAT